MKFKVGDRVRFLNESGGGVVSKIISHALVNVAIEDGFEIPTMVSNLIKVEEENRTRIENPAPSRPVQGQVESGNDQPAGIDRSSPLLSRSGQRSVIPGLYFAFRPVNQRWLLTGNMDVFLLNHTSWDVMFSLLLELPDGGYRCKEFDIIPRNSHYHLATIKPDHIDRWSKGIVQFLFRRSKFEKVMMPASVNFKVSQQRFLVESNYMENALMDGRNFMISLMPMPSVAKVEASREGYEQEVPVAQAKPELATEVIDSYRTRDNQAVVDLHIESLSEEWESLKSHEILSLQKSTFKSCLDSALRSGYRSVTFIHGMGAGRLKQEIISILESYRQVRVQDAPMSEYGQGALELLLPQDSSE